ncbi:hypothetical protein HMI01_27840 [Halolactibacillus miurensis]|uniref:G-rich domain on putative tyrosine kinase n=1 Tax=Halolactibacillus miurensis TaxID=306541 RepID=A0A1I6V2P9_9BACI|nr:Wzz/FepE/Etk N-terminal domain-containing protein [Halolactibacillus miurensis]GEM05796.1 hypothetical protein HMI01_27840 [Halolactibacillus miurensis]SFT07989.1 G-rich domain on putative tyrosine kinase [Halolactibacillus miurensis]
MEEEISLKELLQAILKGKVLIGIITAMAVLIAAGYSYLLVDPVYEGRTIIGFNKVSTAPENVQPLIDELTTIQNFENVLTSPESVVPVIEKLEIDRTYNSLANQIEMSRLNEGEDHLEIKFASSDQTEIESVLSELVVQAKVQLGKALSNRFDLLTDEYERQMLEEEKNIDQAVAAFNNLNAHEKLPTLMLVNENTSGNQYLLDVSEAYLEEFRLLDKTLQAEYNKALDKIDKHTELYNFYSGKLDEVNSVKDMGIINVKVNTVTAPRATMDPISPNKLLNIAIGLVLGLMIGVFVVLFKNYWNDEA